MFVPHLAFPSLLATPGTPYPCKPRAPGDHTLSHRFLTVVLVAISSGPALCGDEHNQLNQNRALRLRNRYTISRKRLISLLGVAGKVNSCTLQACMQSITSSGLGHECQPYKVALTTMRRPQTSTATMGYGSTQRVTGKATLAIVD